MGTNLLKEIPAVGGGLYALAVGGAAIGESTVVRFYATPTPTPAYGCYGMTPALAPGASVGGWAGDNGPMHDAMLNALADGLGLTRAELDSRIAAGETPAQIAAAQGLSQADFASLFAEARQTAIAQAVADGYLTQAQADWMLNHMGGRGGFGNGHCPFYGAGATPNQ